MHPLNGQTPIVYCIGKPIENLNVLVFSPTARALQTFLVFSQHPAWVVRPEN